MLLARRLCERGAGFVTVTTNFVWDMHSDVNNAPVGEGFGYMGVPLDWALSAFIHDLEARGLTDKSCWSFAVRWAARQGSTATAAATTGATSPRCCWSAVGSPAAG